MKKVASGFFYVKTILYISFIIKTNIKMAKKRNVDIDGYSERHLAALIRRNMIQKNHGDESKYNRKNKSWKKQLNQNKDEE